MLIIRLVRTGKKNAPSFRLVLVKKTAPPKSGRFLEILGSYNPRLSSKQKGAAGQKEINLKTERIKYWLSHGISVSETVHNLLVSHGLIKGTKIKKKISVGKKKTVSEGEGEPKKESEKAEEKNGLAQSAKAENAVEEEKMVGEEKKAVKEEGKVEKKSEEVVEKNEKTKQSAEPRVDKSEEKSKIEKE